MKNAKNKSYPPGIHTAIVTPFSGERIDTAAYKHLLDIQLNSSVSGVVVLGTTGESPTVSEKEKEKLISISAEMLSGKKALTVGCGSNDTSKAIEKVKKAAALGAEYALVVVPYYNKPSERGILRHYLTVAESSPIPVIIYNVPSRTGADISAKTLSILSAHPNIAAIKEASPDICSITAKMYEAPDLDFFCGNDTLLYHFLLLGGKGGICVCSNLYPDKTCRIAELYKANKTKASKEAFFALYPYLQALSSDVNPVPIKTLLSACGLISPRVRAPLCEMAEDKRSALLRAAADAGLYIN